MKQAMAFPLSANFATDAGLAVYLREVNRLPVLDAAAEKRLASRYREQGCLDCARDLVLSQLRQVVRVARGFGGYGLPLGDLIQEGNIGLMKAVKHYDPAQGVRLLSFAIHWIRAEIYEYVLRNWRIVRVATTKAQRKLFFNLRKARKQLRWLNPEETRHLAETLDVPASVVSEMDARLSGGDIAFDGHAEDEEGDGPRAPADALGDMRYNPEREYITAQDSGDREQRLAKVMGMLDPRSREILRRRWLTEDKATLHTLAAEFRVSAERIRQIETRALATLRQGLPDLGMPGSESNRVRS